MTYVLAYLAVGLIAVWLHFFGIPKVFRRARPDPDYPGREALTLTLLWPLALVAVAAIAVLTSALEVLRRR